MTENVRVGRSLTIPGDELELTFSASGGPGGQHANKTATRVGVEWNVATSRALGERQRQRIRHHLKNRIDSTGTLRLSSDRHRSQLQNRRDVLERLARLVSESLRPVKPRIATAPSRSAKERRLQDKSKRSALKRSRKISDDD